MPTSEPDLLVMTGIKKSYPGVQALKGVDFTLARGEVHCLVGENGAGKSTLIRVLSGATRPDEGTIAVEGDVRSAIDPGLGHRLGIGVIYQEPDLVPAMTVAENIFLGHEPVQAGIVLKTRDMQHAVSALMARFDLRFRLDAPVRDLGPAQRQLVQILKALSRRIKILVLDEPTASLTEGEIAFLFALISELRSQGLGIVYVSHRLSEITAIADRVTVMRDGAKVATMAASEVTEESLIRAMVGRFFDPHARRDRAPAGATALAVRDLAVRGQFEGISFDLHDGEVLGVAGLVGAGRSELLECLFGVTPADQGSVSLRGILVRFRSPLDAVRHGFGLVPEERRESGLVLGRSVQDNIAFPILRQLTRGLILRRGRLARIASGLVSSLGIKTPSLRQAVQTLSGGNQQKVVLAKWLASDVKVLLLDEPTRGIDVNAKFEIYSLVESLIANGVSIVIASSDMPELLALSDRILVLAEGRLAGEVDARRTDQAEIMRLAVPRGAEADVGEAA